MRNLKGLLFGAALLGAGPALAHDRIYADTDVTVVLGGGGYDAPYWGEERVYYAPPHRGYWGRPYCWRPHYYGAYRRPYRGDWREDWRGDWDDHRRDDRRDWDRDGARGRHHYRNE
jgi:hypothetical protein